MEEIINALNKDIKDLKKQLKKRTDEVTAATQLIVSQEKVLRSQSEKIKELTK